MDQVWGGKSIGWLLNASTLNYTEEGGDIYCDLCGFGRLSLLLSMWVDKAKQAALVPEGMRLVFLVGVKGKYLKWNSITCSSTSTQRSTKLGLMLYDIRTIYYEGE